MGVSEKVGPKYVKIKDSAGKEWLCSVGDIKDVKEAAQEELENCQEFDLFIHNIGILDAER
jgi:hypothetical protein